jgi:hypothetical protein
MGTSGSASFQSDRTQIEFARTKSFLDVFPVINVGKNVAPADDTPVGIP